MVDFINGRYLARSFLDVLTSGLFGKAFSDCVEENIVQTPPSIIAFKTSVTHFKLQEYIKFFFLFSWRCQVLDRPMAGNPNVLPS